MSAFQNAAAFAATIFEKLARENWQLFFRTRETKALFWKAT
jgi:hypothetical protein